MGYWLADVWRAGWGRETGRPRLFTMPRRIWNSALRDGLIFLQTANPARPYATPAISKRR